MPTGKHMDQKPSNDEACTEKRWPALEATYSVQDGQCDDLGARVGTERKDLGPLTMVAVSFNICNSWVAIASSLAIAVSAGGPVNIIYGTFFSLCIYAAVATSLAELASIYPSAGGQYHFASILAPSWCSRGVSYSCGIIAISSWIALTASATLLAAQMLLALPEYYIANYEPQNWHYFVVFQAINLTVLLYNVFAIRFTPRVHDIGFYLTLSTFVAVVITCLAISEKQSSAYVWPTFENATGWPSAVTFLTGLSTPCFMYAGIDATLHLAETCTKPKTAVPRALMTTVVVGFITGFVFSVAMCYGISDLSALVNTVQVVPISTTSLAIEVHLLMLFCRMPIYALWRQATRSPTAATIFLVALLLILFFVVNAMQQTTSRLVHAFGRDNGLIFSSKLATIHETLDVPAWALVADAGCIFAAGCIYLGSPTAFTSLVNSNLRKFCRGSGHFVSPGVVGWTANVVTVLGGVFELVFFCFPESLPCYGHNDE
ncbi:putative amino acid/polyamine transporter I [Septoria linicola]|nr:putative amino acid/polyamine transporter I [Septoria linicola]